MIRNSKDKDFSAAKQEAAGDERQYKASSSSSRQWSSAGFRNPRIVRVSRTFGGKDRHSKVCTVRGLRDRRIRLSVPTAVQLYDLQNRLGLSQPSKVIDWLIDVTKQDIDKLPPLQIPQGVFSQFLHQHDHHHNHHLHQHLNLVPNHDHDHDHDHHHQAKTNEQDQFAQKLFGMPASFMNYYQNSDQTTTSFLGHGIALPQIDGNHGNLVGNSPTTLQFNSPSIQSMSQLFFGSPFPPYLSTHENPHDSIRSQFINNHVQLLSASSSTSASSFSSSSQQFHVLNNSPMSSLHSTSTTSADNNPPLIKSFPAILNPRLLSAYQNRPLAEKDRS